MFASFDLAVCCSRACTTCTDDQDRIEPPSRAFEEDIVPDPAGDGFDPLMGRFGREEPKKDRRWQPLHLGKEQHAPTNVMAGKQVSSSQFSSLLIGEKQPAFKPPLVLDVEKPRRWAPSEQSGAQALPVPDEAPSPTTTAVESVGALSDTQVAGEKAEGEEKKKEAEEEEDPLAFGPPIGRTKNSQQLLEEAQAAAEEKALAAASAA